MFETTATLLADEVERPEHSLLSPKRPLLADRDSEAKNPGLFRTAERWGYVLRFHRKSQLMRRVQAIGMRWWDGATRGCLWNGVPGAEVQNIRASSGLARVARHHLNNRMLKGAACRADAILSGRFRFLNEERLLPNPIDWRLECWPEASHLWRFQLHYHEFLLDLLASWGAARGERHDLHAESIWGIIGQWIDQNRLTDPRVLRDAWHPYCISRRIPAWLSAWTVCHPPPGAARRVLESLVTQASFLERRLELDLGGNHLFENAKALVMVGCFLEGRDARRWLGRGQQLLLSQMAEQVLPHGEHFERSPMYHCAVLEGLLDVADVAADVAPDLSRLCLQTAAEMASFLAKIVHPDGDIPLFGDSCLGEYPAATTIISRARSAAPCVKHPGSVTRSAVAKPSDKLATTTGGYWVFQSQKDFLIFDAGPVAADDLPAHAHSDLLNLEVSINGRRLIVDSGVAGYGEGPLRRYCRSTAAHNVTQIDDAEQCDTWSRFRMGRRGWPSPLRTGLAGEFHWAAASHNAYRHGQVPEVGRLVACRPGGPWVCVDWTIGRGQHRLTNRLHLHPNACATLDGQTARITQAGEALHWQPLGPITNIDILEGRYCPGFGRQEPNDVLCWSTFGPLPRFTGWSLSWGKEKGRGALRMSGGTIQFEWATDDQVVSVPIDLPAPLAWSLTSATKSDQH